MNPVETRLTEAMLEFGARETQFLQDQNAMVFAPAIIAFRTELDIAAEAGVERWQAWRLISTWIKDPVDRLYCLRRVLATLQAERLSLVKPAQLRIIATHKSLRAECLVQMAEIHLQQGHGDEARECYERALPFARASSDYQVNAAVAGSGPKSMEDQIAAALQKLGVKRKS
jgi:hypothetical protein